MSVTNHYSNRSNERLYSNGYDMNRKNINDIIMNKNKTFPKIAYFICNNGIRYEYRIKKNICYKNIINRRNVLITTYAIDLKNEMSKNKLQFNKQLDYSLIKHVYIDEENLIFYVEIKDYFIKYFYDRYEFKIVDIQINLIKEDLFNYKTFTFPSKTQFIKYISNVIGLYTKKTIFSYCNKFFYMNLDYNNYCYKCYIDQSNFNYIEEYVDFKIECKDNMITYYDLKQTKFVDYVFTQNEVTYLFYLMEADNIRLEKYNDSILIKLEYIKLSELKEVYGFDGTFVKMKNPLFQIKS